MFGIPTVVTVVYFFLRIEPETFRYLYPDSRPKRVFVAVLTALFLFAFYGAAGLSDGVVARSMSLISVRIVAPLMAVLTGVASTKIGVQHRA